MQKITRLLIVCAIVALLAASFAGCGQKGKAAVSVVPSEAAAKLLQEVTFRDKLVEAEGEVAKDYYRLDDKVQDFAIYISGSGASAEEIAVIKTTDVKSAKKTVEKRVDDLKFSFEDYVPAEMTKLGDPVIVTKGDVVVLVIADDTAQARKAVDALF